MNRSNIQILVVDDEDLLRQGTVRLLKSAGYEVCEAANGQEALEIITRTQPDLVLLDVNLPDMSGLDICRHVKNDGQGTSIYVVMLSSSRIESDHQVEGLQCGADSYIARPLPNRELLARVQAMLRLKVAEDALKRSEAQLSMALEAAIDGFWDWDVKNDTMYFSPRYYRLLGYDARELGASFQDWIKRVHHREQPQIQTKIEALRNGQVERLEQEYRIQTKDGLWKWLLMRGKVFESDALGPKRIMGTHQDIDERVQMQQEKARLEKRLQQSRKLEALGIMAGGIAHDFNNLLYAISGYMDLAQMDLEPGHPAVDHLQHGSEICVHGRELTQKFITFSKGGAPLKKAVEIEAFLKEVLAAATAGAPIETSLHNVTDLQTICLDPQQIKQALTSLLQNALEAMHNGGSLSIHLQTEKITDQNKGPDPAMGAGDYLRISVKDTGDGIPKEIRGKIFDPYFTTKPMGPEKGMGLGLTIAQSIIKRHDGYIHQASNQGSGAQFDIYLPVYSC